MDNRTSTRPSRVSARTKQLQPSTDGFLRGTAVWLCSSLLYLQFLSLCHLLNDAPLACLPLVALVLWGLWHIWETKRLWESVRLSWDAIAVAVLLCAILCPVAIQPPAGFDVLAYHLPYTVHWMHTGWIEPFYSAFSGAVGYYPGNLELLGVSLCSLASSAFLYNGLNLISVLLLAGVVAALARKMNVRPALAVLVVILMLLTSKVSRGNLGSAYNDLFMAAALVAGLYFSELFFERHRGADLLLAGLLVGVAAGTKFGGALYAAAFALYMIIRSRSLKWSAIVLLCIALPSAYWYLRNWMLTGTPLFPQGVSFAGIELFPGQSSADPGQVLLFRLAEPGYLRSLLDTMETSGHLLLLPLIILFPFRFFRKREAFPFWIAGLVCFGIYLLTPLSAQNPRAVYMNFRYAMPTLWMILCGPGLAELSIVPMARLAAWLDSHRVPVPTLLIIVLMAALPVWGFYSYQSAYSQRVSGSSAKKVVGVRAELGKSWAFLEALPASRIAYTGINAPGALYGSHLQHEAVYININARNGKNYHEYANGNYRAESDYDAWVKNLNDGNVRYLWLYKEEPTVEAQWLSEHPQDFPPVYDDEYVTITRVP